MAVLIGTEYTVPAVDDFVLGRSLHKRVGQPQTAASVVPFAEFANACKPVESPVDGIRCVRTAGDAALEAIAARSNVRPKNDGITLDQILDRESFAP